MKSKLNILWAVLLGIATMSLVTGCDNVFDDLSVNPNQSDVKSFYNTPENCNKGILGIYGYISTPRNLGACGYGLLSITQKVIL